MAYGSTSFWLFTIAASAFIHLVLPALLIFLIAGTAVKLIEKYKHNKKS